MLKKSPNKKIYFKKDGREYFYMRTEHGDQEVKLSEI